VKILIIGKGGQLGKSIKSLVNNTQQGYEFIFTDSKELNLGSNQNIDQYFNKYNYDVIVNCAAYTQVDKAEKERTLANQINHLAVKKLATIAKKKQIKLIHISTDYIFDGESDKPYIEVDTPNPINVYGKTKLAGELAIQNEMPTNAIIIRTSWVYSDYGNNFVSTMLRLGKEQNELNIVSDQIGSPTYALDLAGVILNIILNKKFKNNSYLTKIYHYSNEGNISWYDFAKEIFKLSKLNCIVKPITTDKYPTPALRPKNTTMNKDKIKKEFNLTTIAWKQSLSVCITSLRKGQQ